MIKHFFLYIIVFLFGSTQIPNILEHIPKDFFLPAYSQPFHTEVIDDIYGEMVISQQIQVKAKVQVDKIAIKLATYNNKNIACTLNISLIKDNKTISKSTADCSEIIDNNFKYFTLNPSLIFEKDEVVVVRLQNTGNTDNKIAVYHNSDSPSRVEIGSDHRNGAITMILGSNTTKNQTMIHKQASIVTIAVFVLGLLIIYFGVKSNFANLKFVFIAVLTLSTIRALTMPPLNFPDEHEHFFRALELSNGDFSSAKYDYKFLVKEKYQEFVNKNLWASDKESSGVLSEIKESLNDKTHGNDKVMAVTMAGPYHPLAHMHLALFSKILDLLNINPLIITYILRLENVLIFTALIVFSCWLTPKLTPLFFISGILPTISGQSGSIGLDSLITACITVIFSLHFSKRKQKSKVKILLLIIAVYLAHAKLTYLFISATVLALLFTKKSKTIKIVFLFITASAVLLLSNLLWQKYLDIKGDPRFPDIKTTEQTNLLLSKPFKTLLVITTNIFTKSDYIIQNSLFSTFSNYGFTSPAVLFNIPVIFLLCYIYSFSKITKGNGNYTIIFFLALGLTLFFICFAILVSATKFGSYEFFVPPRYVSFVWIIFYLIFSFLKNKKEDSHNYTTLTSINFSIAIVYLLYKTILITFTY